MEFQGITAIAVQAVSWNCVAVLYGLMCISGLVDAKLWYFVTLSGKLFAVLFRRYLY